MLLRLSPRRDDAAALACEDLASGLDAGLGPSQLGGDAASGEQVVRGMLAARGVRVEPAEDLVLAAAWRSGTAPRALRALAAARRHRAGFARTVALRLAYPLLLIATAVLASAVSAWSLGNTSLLVTVLLLTGAGAAFGWFGLRGIARGSPGWLRLPLVRAWARDLAEVPYLQVLHGLYGSGVPLRDAHREAAAAYGLGGGRQRLLAADRVLQSGQPLADALASDPVLHEETRHLLANGERTGGLEEALQCALDRRRAVAAQRTELLARAVGVCVYGFAAAIAIYVIFSFYGTLYGGLSGRRR